MVNKKAVVLATIIALIVIGGFFGFKIYLMNKDESIDQTSNNTAEAQWSSKTENTDSQTSEPEKANEVENTNSSENNTLESKKETNTTTNNANIKENEAISKDPEDLAIELAKKEWGNKNSDVYFNVDDKISDGVYLVSVRDNSTTTEIASYKVDTNSKKVEAGQ